jgi:predicted aldo/keto reductase-like oxidoreductase
MNADNPDLVRRAYELGIRHFDTAATYMRGRNEQMVGNVIKELGVRDKVVIATKIPPLSPSEMTQVGNEQVKKHCLEWADKSLKRLEADYLDMIYLHDVQDVASLQNAGLRSAFEMLKKQKKARWVGFSTHTNMAALLDEAVSTGYCDAILTAYNYSMSENIQLLKSMKKAAAAGIILVAMKTQCKQPWYLDGYEPSAWKFYEGRLQHTALLKWVLRHEVFATAVPGFQNFQELEEDFSVARDLSFTPEEKKFLEDRNVKLAMRGACQQCYSCAATCPEGVEVPKLLRAHMYAACYSNMAQARETIEEIPQGRGLEKCLSCEGCGARCVNRVNIAARIKELKTICA